MKLTTSRERWALSFLETLKSFWEKMFPEDEKNLEKINDMIHSICWKLKEQQENSDANQV